MFTSLYIRTPTGQCSLHGEVQRGCGAHFMNPSIKHFGLNLRFHILLDVVSVNIMVEAKKGKARLRIKLTYLAYRVARYLYKDS